MGDPISGLSDLAVALGVFVAGAGAVVLGKFGHSIFRRFRRKK